MRTEVETPRKVTHTPRHEIRMKLISLQPFSLLHLGLMRSGRRHRFKRQGPVNLWVDNLWLAEVIEVIEGGPDCAESEHGAVPANERTPETSE